MKKFLFGILGLLFAVPAVADLAPCRNLFDKSLYDGNGWYINTNGVITPYTQNATIPMRLTPGKVYYYKHCSVTGGFRVFYTTEENWTTGSSATWLVTNPVTAEANKVGSFTVPNDAKWVFLLAGRSDSGITATFQEQLDDYMLSEEVLTAATPYAPYEHSTTPIKIATTVYNSARFSPVVTELNDTIATIRDVVTNTINQTKAIADLQATKQTRPDENCPAGKKCLLVEDNDGQPHWFEIVESAD